MFVYSTVVLLVAHCVKMNGLRKTSFYEACRCKKMYHLPIALPLYDAHCHIDLFCKHGLGQTEMFRQFCDGRRMTLIDNRHQHHHWHVNDSFQIESATIYKTYGIHLRYLPLNFERTAVDLRGFWRNKPRGNTNTVAIGERGLDGIRTGLYDQQLIFFRM